ncbi:DUF3995 domain-containing protein [Streptomyces sp. ISL-100]|uniref:DUF3995 domain-containing protein n=1 Tax=Streptomyces sp. ISL-100 TaxID=2819173 RepID=UPI001BE8F146|nr:DUF3995 domain-containing protein [Streptomyces sp. ISL-100]MBT2398399.1 DUF3995 domain-containing protein [Streptomyces sp. ISL-100]
MKFNRHAAATAVAAVLITDGLLHVFWATGRTWPAADATSLSYAVLGAAVPFTPPVVLPLAALLFTAAGLVTARARLGGAHRWGRLLQLGTVAVACGTAVRGLVGVAWAFGVDAGLDASAGDTFYWLNLGLYTPLTLAMAATTARLALMSALVRERS